MMKTPVNNAPAADSIIPGADPRFVFRCGLFGMALSFAAAIAGLIIALIWSDRPAISDGLPFSNENVPDIFHTLRLLLVGAGALLAGYALSLAPKSWQAWAIAGGTAFFATTLGLPDHWDSIRLLTRICTLICAAGALLSYARPVIRYSVISFVALFHFGGILTATTWPDPAPWLTAQAAGRVYMPYLSFIYMRNAYHFYSPEPGPASLLYILVKYELDEIDPATGKPKTVHEWVILPRRDQHMKDPLGLTYYRRLSITEMIAQSTQDLFTQQSFEKLDARQRRMTAAYGLTGREPIPLAPPEIEPEYLQYRIPRQDIARYILPSYARHVAAEYTSPGRKVASVKIYRLEHRIVSVQSFVDKNNPVSPYDPVGYRPYYLGEYGPADNKTDKWELLDPQDPMLYWLVPIVPKPGGPSPADPDRKAYIDYLSKHAGFEVEWRRP